MRLANLLRHFGKPAGLVVHLLVKALRGLFHQGFGRRHQLGDGGVLVFGRLRKESGKDIDIL
ncbi:MAG: hypothetical protein ACQERN_13110 [Thermodesulfobacteriota bacterium]